MQQASRPPSREPGRGTAAAHLRLRTRRRQARIQHCTVERRHQDCRAGARRVVTHHHVLRDDRHGHLRGAGAVGGLGSSSSGGERVLPGPRNPHNCAIPASRARRRACRPAGCAPGAPPWGSRCPGRRCAWCAAGAPAPGLAAGSQPAAQRRPAARRAPGHGGACMGRRAASNCTSLRRRRNTVSAVSLWVPSPNHRGPGAPLL